MDATTQINKFSEFIEDNYHTQLLEQVAKGNKFLVIDFTDLSKYDPDLAELLLEFPEETLKAAELALGKFLENDQEFIVRVRGLPDSQRIRVRDIRSNHINKFLYLEGVVRQKSDVRPQVTTSRYECPSCGNVMNVIQLDKKLKEPNRCGCGRKGKFTLIHKELVDAQGIVIEEAAEDLDGGEQPKRINVLLKADLVSPLSDRMSNPGTQIILSGILKEVPIIMKSGGQSTRFDLIIEANYFESSQEDFTDINITEEEEAQIKEIAKDPQLQQKLVSCIAPSIYGHNRIKESLLLQLVGGVKKSRDDGAVTRGDMHILLIGDPGAGKSQLLKRIDQVAPKSRFVSGKGASGAGITAAVVKDEFLQGWSLEAGAMVLANKGILCLDEIDKMSTDDTSSLHEGLEGQSYHPDTEILFSDGSKAPIGKLIDARFEKHKDEIVQGINCEFLFQDDLEIWTTNFQRIRTARVNRISRHAAPKFFVEITYKNGRTVKVTPEHPVFIHKEGAFVEVPAIEVTKDMLVPAPRNFEIQGKLQKLKPGKLTHPNNKPMTFPKYLNKNVAKLLGYVASEGHSYFNPKTKYAEIGVNNTSIIIKEEAQHLFESIFGTTVNVNSQRAKKRKKATKDHYTVRCSSIPLYRFFERNFSEILFESPKKRVPQKILRSSQGIKYEFLQAYFAGDGFVDSCDFGFSTSSIKMAEDLQDLLMGLGIWNYIRAENRAGVYYHKVIIAERESKFKFLKCVVPTEDSRRERVLAYCKKSEVKANFRDPIPVEILTRVKWLLRELKMDDGYFHNSLKGDFNAQRGVVNKYLGRAKEKIMKLDKEKDSLPLRPLRRKANIQLKGLSKSMGCSSSMVYHIENKQTPRYPRLKSLVSTMVTEKITDLQKELDWLYKYVNSDIRLLGIKNVQLVFEPDIKWVYDVTVLPNQTFISQGVVLHNSITISKANIQATLRCETSVLAAANPKWGRFDPYEAIAKQIELPTTLINRFDLIFPIKDLPDVDKDQKMADFILKLHMEGTSKEVPIDTHLLRKYLAFAKQRFQPLISEGAAEKIKEYFLKMRAAGTGEGVKSIPISARQLEGLVRMTEAAAKLRLSHVAEAVDAEAAIDLLDFCLRQIAMDEETGTFDIDRIGASHSASQRNKIHVLRDIITSLEEVHGKQVPLQDIIEAAKEKGISENDVFESLERLKRTGDLFSPKPDVVQRI